MLWGLAGKLLGLGPSILDLGKQYLDLKKSREEAKSNEEIAKINSEMAAVSDRRAVLVAEAGSRVNAIFRVVAAIGPITLLTKIFIWDKVVGSFRGCAGEAGRVLEHCVTHRTDVVSIELWAVITAVIAFYFLATRK